MAQEKDSPAINNLWEWLLSNAGKLRDLALAGAAGSYALGFIIWSAHAFANGLGLLPLLSSQYIIAGLLPMTFLGLAIAMVYFISRMLSKGDGGRSWPRKLVASCMIFLLFMIFYFLLSLWVDFNAETILLVAFSSLGVSLWYAFIGPWTLTLGTGYVAL